MSQEKEGRTQIINKGYRSTEGGIYMGREELEYKVL